MPGVEPTWDPQLYARSFTDVYDHWYHDLDDPSLLVQAFASRCGAGARIVELGSGTGRLATPLGHAGFHVVALDASPAMLARALTGPLPVAADMAAMPLVDACADAVLVAYNTMLNLDGFDQQQQCFYEIARVLRPGGVAVVEAFIANTEQPSPFGVTMRDHPGRDGGRIAIITGPDAHDPDVIVGSHVELQPAVVCRPWRLRYSSPEALDRCAHAAGLVVSERYSDWSSRPFDAADQRHVTWYTHR